MTTGMFTKPPYLICLVIMVGLPGCASRTQRVAAPNVAVSSVATTQPNLGKADIDRQFVATVQALPPAQRIQYIQRHPDLAQKVMQNPDPKVSGTLQHLMPFKK